MLMYGTTMFLIAATGRLVRHAALWSTAGVDAGSNCLSGGMATSGALTTWFAELAGEPSVDRLFERAPSVPAGSRGLLTLPYFAGEPTPIADPNARGVIAGLTLGHDRYDVFRSLVEATALGVRHNLEAFAESGAPISRVIAVGGGTAGGLWPQIVSDVTGCEQIVPLITVGASYGDARMAAESIGAVRDGEASWMKIDTIVHPNPAVRPIYDDLYARYRALYVATADIVHSLGRTEVTQ